MVVAACFRAVFDQICLGLARLIDNGQFLCLARGGAFLKVAIFWGKPIVFAPLPFATDSAPVKRLVLHSTPCDSRATPTIQDPCKQKRHKSVRMERHTNAEMKKTQKCQNGKRGKEGNLNLRSAQRKLTL